MAMRTIIIDHNTFVGKTTRFLRGLFSSTVFGGPTNQWKSDGQSLSGRTKGFRQHELFLSEDEYHIHRFQIPGQLRSELRQIARFEIESSTPFQVDEVYHWLEIGRADQTGLSKEDQVSCTIVPKHLVHSALSSIGGSKVRAFTWITLLDSNENACARVHHSSITKRTRGQQFARSFFLGVPIFAIALTTGLFFYDSNKLNELIMTHSAELETSTSAYSVLAAELRELDGQRKAEDEVRTARARNRIPIVETIELLIKSRRSGVEFRSISIQPVELTVSLDAPDIVSAKEAIAAQFQGDTLTIQGAISRKNATTETATLLIRRKPL